MSRHVSDVDNSEDECSEDLVGEPAVQTLGHRSTGPEGGACLLLPGTRVQHEQRHLVLGAASAPHHGGEHHTVILRLHRENRESEPGSG